MTALDPKLSMTKAMVHIPDAMTDDMMIAFLLALSHWWGGGTAPHRVWQHGDGNVLSMGRYDGGAGRMPSPDAHAGGGNCHDPAPSYQRHDGNAPGDGKQVQDNPAAFDAGSARSCAVDR